MNEKTERDLKILRERATAIVDYFRSQSLGCRLHAQTDAVLKEVFAGQSIREHLALIRELDFTAEEGLYAEQVAELERALVARFGRVGRLRRVDWKRIAEILERGRIGKGSEVEAVRRRVERIKEKPACADEFKRLNELLEEYERRAKRQCECLIPATTNRRKRR